MMTCQRQIAGMDCSYSSIASIHDKGITHANNNSAFCPRTVHTCFVWCSIITLNSINPLVFVSEKEYVALQVTIFRHSDESHTSHDETDTVVQVACGFKVNSHVRFDGQ
jgi:hypothetical protein